MSDRNRRNDRRRPGQGNRSSRPRASNDDPSQQRPVILAKPDRERDFPTLQQAHQPHHSQQPQQVEILTKKPNTSRSSSPTPGLGSGQGLKVAKQLLNRKEPNSTTSTANRSVSPRIEIQAPIVPVVSLMSDRSVKLIDEQIFSEYFSEYLSDNTEFLVVGIMGQQSSGKSSIMNALARGLIESGQGEESSNDGGVDQKNFFRVQSFEKQMTAEHCTNGVSVWISPKHRIILIDTQPINSPSVLDRAIQLDKKFSSEFSNMEVTVEIQSLQMAAFLMNVCHVLIVTQDYQMDQNFLRFLFRAEMMKPSSPALSSNNPDIESLNQIEEYFPDILFLHNRSQLEDFTDSNLKKLKSTYSKIFARSQLRIATGSGLNISDFLDTDPSDRSFEDNVNAFLLPDLFCQNETSNFSSELKYEQFVGVLRKKVFSTVPRPLSTIGKMSEKAWLTHAVKSWDIVKNSNLFHDYHRLLI